MDGSGVPATGEGPLDLRRDSHHHHAVGGEVCALTAVDVRPLKDRIRATNHPDEPARILVEALPDTLDAYSFSVAGETLVRILTTQREAR